MSDELKGIVKPGSVPIAEIPDGGKIFREEDLEEGVRARHRELRESMGGPDHARALAAGAAFPGWVYAVADEALPKNADAAVIRDPDKCVRRILVFNEISLNDCLVSLARIALAFTEDDSSEATDRQIVLIWRNGQIEVDGKRQSMGTVSVVERGDASAISRRKGKAIRIAGIGGVRVVGGAEEFT